MVATIESLDCALPSFSHSEPFHIKSGVIGLSRNFVWWFQAKESQLYAVTASQLAREANGSDFASMAAQGGIRSSLNIELSNQPGSFVCSSDEDSVLLRVSGDMPSLLWVRANAAHIEKVSEFEFTEEISCAVFAGDDKLMVMTKDGMGYLIHPDGLREQILCLATPSRRVMSIMGEHLLISEGKEMYMSLIASNSSLEAFQIIGEIPAELGEYHDYSVCGMCPISDSEAALMGTCDDGQNCLISLVEFDFSSKTMRYKFFSFNDLFLSSGGDSVQSTGHMRWIPEVSLLLAGHSFSDSAAVFQKSGDSWKCLNPPEGKQLTCALIGGDMQNCRLDGLAVCLLDEPIEMEKSADQISQIEMVVLTLQRGGWMSCHYGDLPDDMPVVRREQKVAKVADGKV